MESVNSLPHCHSFVIKSNEGEGKYLTSLWLVLQPFTHVVTLVIIVTIQCLLLSLHGSHHLWLTHHMVNTD